MLEAHFLIFIQHHQLEPALGSAGFNWCQRELVHLRNCWSSFVNRQRPNPTPPSLPPPPPNNLQHTPAPGLYFFPRAAVAKAFNVSKW